MNIFFAMFHRLFNIMGLTNESTAKSSQASLVAGLPNPLQDRIAASNSAAATSETPETLTVSAVDEILTTERKWAPSKPGIADSGFASDRLMSASSLESSTSRQLEPTGTGKGVNSGINQPTSKVTTTSTSQESTTKDGAVGSDGHLTYFPQPIDPVTGTAGGIDRTSIPKQPVDPQPDPQPDPEPEPFPRPDPSPDGEGPQTIAPTDLPVDGSPIDVIGGRVERLAPNGHEDAQSVRIIDGPEHGNLTVNPDNTLALVMTTSDYTGPLSFRYEIIHQDGTTEVVQSQLNVVAGSQEAGWGQGHHYMLETDENDDVIVEIGDNHRKVFISDSKEALSRADIAAMENLSESDITRQWLLDHPMYGADEEMALKPEVGMDLWYGLTWETEPNSNWLMFERGYEYDNLGQLISRGSKGEDELHPQHVTSWGDVTKEAVILSEIKSYQRPVENMVFTNLTLKGGVNGQIGDNILFHGIDFTGNGPAIQHMNQVTIRNSMIHDIYREDPILVEGFDGWFPHANRTGGLYSGNTNGLLLENLFVNQNGWAEGYDPNGALDKPQPPSMFSHNLYIQVDVRDFTMRDSISSKASSFGLNAKSGGFIVDNMFFENNANVSFMGGNEHEFTNLGNYTLFMDNVVTSAAYKTAYQIGAVARAVDNGGAQTSLVDNIIAHLADPNNQADLESKEFNSGVLTHLQDPFFDDTVIYNWHSWRDERWFNPEDLNQNVENLDRTVADQTTVQNLARQILNDPNATVNDLVDHIESGAITADELIAFFQDGFGIKNGVRTEAETLRFIPNALGDGVRWDNRLNWSTEDTPGTADGDRVDLGGNWVNYSGNNAIDYLVFGHGGELNVRQGKLTVEGGARPGGEHTELNIDDAGQFWTNSIVGAHTLTVNIDGGRFANTGHVDGDVDFYIRGGDALLATDNATMDLEAGDALKIFGDDADVGFDGKSGGTGVLRLHEGSMVKFIADADGFSTIEEFRSGAFGANNPNIQSGINLGNSILKIDINALGGEMSEHTLMSVDALTGTFSEISILGLAENRNAEVKINYVTDKVTLLLHEAGKGKGELSLKTHGDINDNSDGAELWVALTQGRDVVMDAPPPVLHEEDPADNYIRYDTGGMFLEDAA